MSEPRFDSPSWLKEIVLPTKLSNTDYKAFIFKLTVIQNVVSWKKDLKSFLIGFQTFPVTYNIWYLTEHLL
jgi:hypothetical protein